MEIVLIGCAAIVVFLVIRFAFRLGRAVEKKIPTPRTAPQTLDRYKRLSNVFPYPHYKDVYEYIGSRNAAQLADMANAFEGVLRGAEVLGNHREQLSALFQLLREGGHAPWPRAEAEILSMSEEEFRALTHALRNL